MFFLDSQIQISFAFLNNQFSFTNVISQKLDTIGSAFALSLRDKYIIKLTDILSSTLLKPYAWTGSRRTFFVVHRVEHQKRTQLAPEGVIWVRIWRSTWHLAYSGNLYNPRHHQLLSRMHSVCILGVFRIMPECMCDDDDSVDYN